MPELCARCQKGLEKGDTTITVAKGLKKFFYHARCFGAGHIEEKVQGDPQQNPDSRTSNDLTKG